VSPTDVAQAPRPAPFARRISATTIIVAVALVLAVALAWAWLLSSPMRGGGGMGGMTMPPNAFSAAYLLPAVAMWSIMMVAMMVPSAAPMILLHARVDRTPSTSARLGHTLLFGLAYVLVWTGFSLVAASAQAALVTSGVISAAALAVGTRGLAAVLLIAAALYELTTAKRLCLDQCQSPLLFFYRHFRPGAAGALRLGIVHGLFCLGCCWALMLLLFVGGVMNLAWVALLGIVVLGQKLAPRRWGISRFTAAALAAAALAILLS
jgi:predicted metal-binding membrane protein